MKILKSEYANIILKRQNGMRAVDIAHEYGVNPNTIYKILDENVQETHQVKEYKEMLNKMKKMKNIIKIKKLAESMDLQITIDGDEKELKNKEEIVKKDLEIEYLLEKIKQMEIEIDDLKNINDQLMLEKNAKEEPINITNDEILEKKDEKEINWDKIKQVLSTYNCKSIYASTRLKVLKKLISDNDDVFLSLSTEDRRYNIYKLLKEKSSLTSEVLIPKYTHVFTNVITKVWN